MRDKNDKIRERLEEIDESHKFQGERNLMVNRRKHFDMLLETLEKVLDECERDHPSEHIEMSAEQLADRIITIIQNELCEEVDIGCVSKCCNAELRTEPENPGRGETSCWICTECDEVTSPVKRGNTDE